MNKMNEELLKTLSNSIVSVLDTNNVEILYNKAEIKPYLFKFSSTHKEKPTLFLDNKPYSSKNKFKITYKCSCGTLNTILLEKFLLKEKLSCHKCSQTEELKKWHGEVIKNIHRGLGYVSKDKKKIKRLYDFEKENEEFKNEFYINNLTHTEYEKVIKYVYSIDSVEIENKNIIFLEHENGVNAKKYRQMVMIEGVKHPFKKIVLKCPLCGKIFSVTRPIKERILHNNFDCKKCYLNNHVFPVKKYREGLTYQGNLELNFIKRCDNENLKITDGAEVEYNFNNKKSSYKIDFCLPQYKLQVETKDNHIWHREQVKSGKWAKKEEAAVNYCTKNGMKYVLLFPNEIEEFFKNLLKR